MTAILMGDIADAIFRAVATAIPYSEENVLRACVEAVVPKRGIIIEATKEEIRANKDLGGILFHEGEVRPKEGASK